MFEDSTILKYIVELGALAIIFLFAIREFFAYLKSRNQNSSVLKNGDISAAILKELQLMNNNHLSSIKDVIEEGNSRLISSFQSYSREEHNTSIQIISLLSEIKGKLEK